MTQAEATTRAHALWHTEGQGIAVSYHPLRNGHPAWDERVYVVGIAKDEDSLEVYGRSTVSFEEAFRQALNEAEDV